MDEKELLIDELLSVMHPKKRHARDMAMGDKGTFRVLFFLWHKDGKATPGEISEDMEVTTPRVTVLLNEMEEKGLIRRSILPQDRRKVCVELTEKGLQAVEEHRRERRGFAREVIEEVGEADVRAYIRVCQAIHDKRRPQ